MRMKAGRKASGAADPGDCSLDDPSPRHDLEGVGRLRDMRGQEACRYLEVRRRHSAAIAASKLSVAKSTGKFSTLSDHAATQQVPANRERTVSSSTDFSISTSK